MQWSVIFWASFAMILYVVFGFNVISAAAWDGPGPMFAGMTTGAAPIRGLGGLAQMLVFFVSVPIYLSSIVFIWKEAKFPFEIPGMPKFGKKKTNPDDEPREQPIEVVDFPSDLPFEMREMYLKIIKQTVAADLSHFMADSYKVAEADNRELVVSELMPPPPSFAVDAPGAAGASAEDSAAVPSFSNEAFKDFSFGDPSRPDNFRDDKQSLESESPLSVIDLSPFHFDAASGVATYIFDDPDFWVPDDVHDWAAAGKQISSPIKLLMESGADKKLLHLSAKNIQNLDKHIKRWKEMGIEVIVES